MSTDAWGEDPRWAEEEVPVFRTNTGGVAPKTCPSLCDDGWVQVPQGPINQLVTGCPDPWHTSHTAATE